MSQPPAIDAVWRRQRLLARRRGGGLGGPRRMRYQWCWASWPGFRRRRLRWAVVHRRIRPARLPRWQTRRRRRLDSPLERHRRCLPAGAWHAEAAGLPGFPKTSRRKRRPQTWQLFLALYIETVLTPQKVFPLLLLLLLTPKDISLFTFSKIKYIYILNLHYIYIINIYN